MGIFDIFKSAWSAGVMTEEDRKKIFWYLKRKTSYTAWKREADAFDRLAEIFEKQVREQPHAPGLGNGTNWEWHYPEILQCQVLYEQALNRLKQGDRSVWLYNERGLLDDAKNIVGSWSSVGDPGAHHGPQGDKEYFGKYVSELKLAMDDFAFASRDTGYLQPQFADRPAPELFEKGYFDRYQYPEYIPEVPIPKELIVVRTDEEAPVFGIYEPQLKDGCMNYLLAGVPAPTYGLLHPRPVTWKLIWEDTRYLDGHVSNEENLYFPPQSKPKAPLPAIVGDDLIAATTGQVCPKDGHWAVMNDLQGKIKLKKGDTMPQHQGRDVTWVWSA